MPAPNIELDRRVTAAASERGYMSREASIVSSDHSARTIELAFSSEVEVERDGWIEILSHEPSAVDLSRLNNGGALLEDHDWKSQRGVVERAWIDADGRGRALVRFSRTPQGEALFTDVADGIKRNVSVGYSIKSAKVVGERDDGTDIILVTRWQPYEISIVAVPADTTVGVGRSADNNQSQRKSRSMSKVRSADAANAEIVTTIREAMAAQPYRAHTPVGAHQPTGLIPTPTLRSVILPLQTTSLTGLFNADGKLSRTPAGTPAGQTVRLSGALIENSRVARAGAHVIVRGDSGKGIRFDNTTDGIAFERLPSRFVSVGAMQFYPLASEDADAPLVPLPIARSDIEKNWGSAEIKAFRIELNRSAFDMVNTEDLIAEVMTAVTLGIARAADETLLTAAVAATPSAFSLASLAAKDLQISDVHALVGASATGASIGSDGVLRAAGIPATLTPDVPGTLIADWSRTAVVVGDEVTLLFKRTSNSGKLEMSGWLAMMPVIPDPSYIWSVA
jgi:phage head maturation protease